MLFMYLSNFVQKYNYTYYFYIFQINTEGKQKLISFSTSIYFREFLIAKFSDSIIIISRLKRSSYVNVYRR